MGNHQAGWAMVETAVALAENAPHMEPLAILDIACESYRGCDAEFDCEGYPGMPFGNLLVRAFPEAQEADEEGDGAYWAFRKRYGLV